MNKWIYVLLSVILLTSTAAMAAGDAPVADKPATQPAKGKVLPEIKFDGISLSDALSFLRDVSGDNIVMVDDGGGDPSLGSVHLKNVTAKQFLDLLPALCKGTEVIESQGETGPIYVVKVHSAEPAPRVAVPAVPVPGAAGMPEPVNLDAEQVHVFRLNAIVERLAVAHNPGLDDAALPQANKKALDDIVSLIQAAADATGDHNDKVQLKVHEPTQTLIFKGSGRKLALLQETLDVLQQPNDSPADAQRSRSEVLQMRKSFEAEIERDRAKIDAMTAQMMQTQALLDEYAKRLGAAKDNGSKTREYQDQQNRPKPSTQP